MEWLFFGLLAVLWIAWMIGKASRSPERSSYEPREPREPQEPRLVIRDGSLPRPEPAFREHHEPGRWVPASKSITIAGYSIRGGMLYVGDRMPAVARHSGTEPALINPSLPIRREAPDTTGSLMSHWPSYSAIDPRSRAAYLEWLAGGRTSSPIGIGYVFLFLYGLERRALSDAQRHPVARAELPSILKEVKRLLRLYGDNRSFNGYARSFLDLLVATSAPAYELRPPPPDLERRGGVPFSVRVALGTMVSKGRPIPAEWALAWYRSSPTTSLRMPATRCPEKLAQLFAIRYAERLGDGLRIRPNKTPLMASYRPASASFGGRISISPAGEIGKLPDVTALKRPLSHISKVAEECISELDPYSRWIGKNPELGDTITAVALLPPALAAKVESDDLNQLTEAIEARLGSASEAEIPMVDLIDHWAPGHKGKLSHKQATLLAQLLSNRGYGLEPDVRFGGVLPDPTKIGVVFRCPPGSPTTPSPSYAAASIALHLGVAVAAADDHVSPAEMTRLEGMLEALPLTPEERRRLHAHMQWLLTALPSFAGLKKRLDELTEMQRVEVAELCVSVATADGRMSPDEVALLRHLHELLSLDSEQVYSRLHARTTMPSRGPVAVTLPGPAPLEHAIPRPTPPTRPETRGVQLDPERLRSTFEQTASVSALLTSIFADDEGSQPMPAPTPARPQESILGLDEAHSSLLRALIVKPEWTRAELENLAEAQGLLPDGAVDVINEAALEACGDILLDGQDPIWLDLELLEEAPE